LLDSDVHRIKTAYQTAEQDLENIVELLFLKYEQEFEKKFDFKSYQSPFDLTSISKSIESRILSSFKEQTSKYKNKTLSYNFNLRNFDYNELIHSSENKIKTKIKENVCYYQKQVENKTVVFSNEFINLGNQSNKIAENIFIRFKNKMEVINKRIWKIHDLNFISNVEKNDVYCSFKEICDIELNSSKQFLDFERQNELKERFSECSTKMLQRIDNQIKVYKSKLDLELKEYNVICSDIANHYDKSRNSSLDYFVRQYQRYHVGDASNSEINIIFDKVDKLHELGLILQYKTLEKFKEQSFKLNHDRTSFDFNVFEQIKNYEELTKSNRETWLREELSTRWRKEYYEKLFPVFGTKVKWITQKEGYVQGTIKTHFSDFKFE